MLNLNQSFLFQGEINQIQWGATQPDWIGENINNNYFVNSELTPVLLFSDLLQQESGDFASLNQTSTCYYLFNLKPAEELS